MRTGKYDMGTSGDNWESVKINCINKYFFFSFQCLYFVLNKQFYKISF